MVCSRGESLTHRITQMKLFNAIATAAALISASLIASTPVEASRNGWLEAGCDIDDECLYVRRKSKTGSIAKFQTKLTRGAVRERTGNCYTWQVNDYNKNMKDVMPDTLIDAALKIACR